MSEMTAEQLRASLYAGVYSVPLKSILDGATAEQLNASIQTSYGWVPNSMDETASYFAQGLYINKVDAWVTDGTLRIGIRKETGEEGDWVIFDNFRLTYYGTKAPAGIDPSTLNSQPYLLCKQSTLSSLCCSSLGSSVVCATGW